MTSNNEEDEVLYTLNAVTGNGEEILLGYSIDRANADKILRSIDKAAREAGAIPFQEISLEDSSKKTTSQILRSWIDDGERLIQEAESIINDDNDEDAR